MDDAFTVDGENYSELTVDEWECVMSFHSWYQEMAPEIVANEIVCYNETEGYAGTIDLLCKIEGQLFVVDVKTSQNVWPEHELQVSAYCHCSADETPPLGAILQVGYRKNKKRWKWTPLEDKYPLFLAAKQIWHAENDGVTPKQKDYPVELTITRNGNAKDK